MDRHNTVKREINPRKTANILSLVTFFYTIKFFLKGFTKGLEIKDIYEVLPDFRATILDKKIEQQWQKESERRKKSPSICRVLWKLHAKTFLFIGFVQMVTTVVITTWSPKAVSKLISYFTPAQNHLTKKEATFYACLIIGLNIVNSVVGFNLRLRLAEIAIKVNAAVYSLLYKKSLKMTSNSLSNVTAGKIVTIITTDLGSMEAFMSSLNAMWIALLKIGLICYLIYKQIGVASFAGITFFLVILPLQIFIATMTYNYKLKCSKKSDERLDLIREVLTAGKIIKMYTWENFFEKKIQEARKKELKELLKLYYCKVWITVIGSMCSKTAFFIFLMTYVWMGNDISAETVFYILTCCNDLEQSLGKDLPCGCFYIVQLLAVAHRIESVLTAKEIQTKQKLIESKYPKIVFKEVDVETVLRSISITISKGFYIVVGHTGSGKTTFLKSILQECQTTGEIEIHGTISYASQEPWLFPSTIKNNILFGEKYCSKRYYEVLRICNLEYDLDLLVEGDSTIVGESGINLSKGQQSRINLARALYRKSDIYLLDDCLASLDGNVSDNIFEKGICEFLKDKLCVVVCNNFDYNRKVDEIIEINTGSVKFNNDLKRIQLGLEEETLKNINLNLPNGNVKPIEENNMAETQISKTKDIYHERKESGRVPLTCYIEFIKYGGVLMFALVIAILASTHFAFSYSDKTLSTWVNLGQNVTNFKKLNQTITPEYETVYQEKNQELLLYVIAIITFLILSLVKSFIFLYFIRLASYNMHKTMVKSIVNTTMKFFDSHFIGNVLNRFTKDYFTLDDTLAFVALECLTMIFSVSGAVIILTTVDYIFLVETIVLLLVVCAIKEFCQPTGRNMERIHVIARSPINGHFNSTLEGLTTIRASDAQDTVVQEFHKRQDVFISAFHLMVTASTSLSFFLKMVCIVFSGVIMVQFLITDIGGSVGDVGLVITQSFMISEIITHGVACVADYENLMISIERILEYIKLEQEEKGGLMLTGWPSGGSIDFKHVSLHYENKEMLTDISFTLNSEEKIGIIGRTGAGKSSLISALFRLYPTTGKITIDGTNIQDVSLKWLRSNISVIPQNPYLFSGTIRENLDPLKQSSDEQIWKILNELQLDNLIGDLSVTIDKGSSFSAGQKQLLCLARVILRRNKIVILDEATANVDPETENLMQETINKYFETCTMLVIAHKTLPVKKCKKLIVLDQGQIRKLETLN